MARDKPLIPQFARNIAAEGVDHHRRSDGMKRTTGQHKLRFRLGSGEVVFLTAMQRAFVSEYLIDFNAREAAKRAGYTKWSAVGPTTPISYEAVQRAIESEMDLRARRNEVTVDRVIAEYAKVAFADLSKMMEFKDGKLQVRDTNALSSDDAAAISEVSITPSGNVRVKLHDKTKALDALAKHLGLFKEHNKREVTLTLEQLVLSSYSNSPALPAPTEEPLTIAEKLVKVEYDKAYGTGSRIVDALVVDEQDDGGDDA